MKEYIMILDPFVVDQQVYECVNEQLKIAATFQLTKIESYAPVFELLKVAKDEQVVINLKCPKPFREKVKETIYSFNQKMQFNKDNVIIKDI